jgi:hypothetical protein
VTDHFSQPKIPEGEDHERTGVLFAPFAFGLFLLSLVGVLGGLRDRKVRQHHPMLDPTRWRNGS